MLEGNFYVSKSVFGYLKVKKRKKITSPKATKLERGALKEELFWASLTECIRTYDYRTLMTRSVPLLGPKNQPRGPDIVQTRGY